MPAPTPTFTWDIAERILGELENGRTLRDICRDEGMPAESTVRKWARDDVEGFFAHYTRARELGYHAMAEETIEIADDARNDWMERRGEDSTGWQLNGEHVQRTKLRLDQRKWFVSKVLPKIYGDRVVNEHVGKDGGPIQTEEISARDRIARKLSSIAARTGAAGDTGGAE